MWEFWTQKSVPRNKYLKILKQNIKHFCEIAGIKRISLIYVIYLMYFLWFIHEFFNMSDLFYFIFSELNNNNKKNSEQKKSPTVKVVF